MSALLHELVGRFALRATYRRALYLLLALPIGVATFTAAVVGLATGGSLVIVWVGLPLLWATLWTARRWAGVDRMLANRLIDARIPSSPPEHFDQPTAGRRLWARLKSRRHWREIAWMLVRLPLGVVGVVTVWLAWIGILMIANGWFGLMSDATTSMRWLTIAGGVALILLTPHAIDGAAALHGWAARRMLGTTDRERLAAATMRTAQAEARTDLARDLHDSVGHSVTAALMQASAARRMIEKDPAYAASALEAVEEQGRAALEELDRVLAVIRNEQAATTAIYGLELVDELLARVRAAGQPLSINRSGDVRAVPPVVGQEAYRVLQEGLTNAMRHAPGARTDVQLAVGDDEIVVAVRNEPPPEEIPPRPTGGRGLTGISERVQALGGSLSTGPTPDGGFTLHASLPFGENRGT